MSAPLTVAVAGIGGYGNGYVAALLDAPADAGVRFLAAVDPSPTSCRRLADVQSAGVPIYPTLEAMYADRAPDLLCVVSPLHFHAQQTCHAVEHGSHVLCEKPLCVTPDEVRQMLAARDRTGKHVAIGYQWSFSVAMQALKADVLAGRFGRPRRLRTIALWPRDEAYYARNGWAGRQRDAHGRPVFDSPVNNACAHYFHNMLFVLGGSPEASLLPDTVAAELYRAHPIDNYDTAAVRCRTRGGVEILFVVSHATQELHGPVFSYEFERGTVELTANATGTEGTITARFADGTVHDYGTPAESRDRKLWLTLDSIRAGRRPLCGIETATPHTLCTWTAQRCVERIAEFPRHLIHTAGEPGKRKTWVEGLGEQLGRCFSEYAMPSELGFPWAVAGRELPVER